MSSKFWLKPRTGDAGRQLHTGSRTSFNWAKLAYGPAFLALGFIVATALGTGTASAKDAVAAYIDDAPGSISIDENGNPLAVGTYAIGTIKILYNYTGDTFQAGYFNTFTVCLPIQQKDSKPSTKYPLDLNLHQVGSVDVTLTPVQDSFAVDTSTIGDERCTDVDINIPQATVDDPDYQVDGVQLVGVLQIDTTPQGAKLDTVTTIKVYITLLHPSEDGCLRLVNFIADRNLSQNISTAGLTVYANPGNNKTVTNPPQLSDVAMIVNQCAETKTFRTLMTINSNFALGPGNPVKARQEDNQEVLDPATFLALYDDSSYDSGAANSALCTVSDFSLDPGDTQYVLAKMAIKDDGTILSAGQEYDGFEVGAYSSLACADIPGSTLDTDGTPNPATTTIPVNALP